MKVKATIHGAISIVNAIATGKGSTLGTEMKVDAILETSQGRGITIEPGNGPISTRLVNRTIEKIVPKKELAKTKISVSFDSEIPTGYGLKSSSAISTATAMACAKIFKPNATDQQVLLAGVDASIETKISLTGAYDDACACYYGGFAVTDNFKKKLIHSEKCPRSLSAVIFIPRSRKRGNVKKLKTLNMIFEYAWNLARNSDYWNAMVLNGLATSSILNSDPKIITDLLERGALAASVSGNGPSIAAVVKQKNLASIQKVFSALEGRIVVSRINNKKAEVHEL